MQLIDSHCHIHFDPLVDDIDGILARAAANGVTHMLCVSVRLEDYPQVEKLASDHDNIFASVGVHPNYTDCRDPEPDELVALAEGPKVVAIGETGLDYFRGEQDSKMQQRRFENHIEAGKASGKPLIVHTRAAANDTMTMLESLDAASCGGVMHCFAEDWPTAKRALDIGFYISFSGIVTFKNATALQDVARRVPADRMLVETDAPYLAPVPWRGKVNEPGYVLHTAEKLAELRNTDMQEVADTTTRNFFHLFAAAA